MHLLINIFVFKTPRGPMAENSEEKKKKKVPTALKRKIQDDKKRIRRKAFKSSIKTAIKTVQEAVKSKESKDKLTTALNSVYSLADKGVKKSVLKQNAAARIKARAAKSVL
jgi:small subunit ribosomal protein S20